MAPHAQATGSKLLVHATGATEEEASETVNSVMGFTSGAVTAAATIFEGIEESVKLIGTSIGENSGKIIEHKYGPDAAGLATDTFETIGNVYTVSKNTKIFKPKNILKTTVKNTGKGILQEIGSSHRPVVEDGEKSLEIASPAIEDGGGNEIVIDLTEEEVVVVPRENNLESHPKDK